MSAKNRRKFIASASLLACSPILVFPKDIPGKTGKLLHLVFFWLKNPASETDRNELVRGLNSLKNIPLIEELMVGTPASTQKRDVIDSSYGVSALMIFDSVESQDAYQVHPLHTEFVVKNKHLWDRVVVYDSLITC